MLLGIDEGTSAVKAVLYDDDLTPVREARREKRTTHPRPGWVEQDAEAILEAIVSAAAEALGPDRVDAVGLDHQGESVVAWDGATGRPLSPVVTWQDKRGAPLLDGVASAVIGRTGLPADPYFSASKIAWLLRDGGVAPDARIGTVDSFVCDRLGAGFATDPSTASRTLLNVPGEPAWDAELCAAFGIPVEVLPQIADTCGELGELDGIGPLRARCCDQQAALAGAGCVRPGMVKATYGTGVFVLAHVGGAAPAVDGLLPTVAWRAGGRTEFALDGGVFTAGALVDWLAELLGTDAGSFLAGAADDPGEVRILPALAGLGAPWWQADATGVIGGLSRGSGAPQLARAALEGIAWRVADVLALFDAAELRVDGGLTRSDALLALQADVTGVPVRRTAADATARGAAALAAVGAGLLPGTAAIEDLIPAGPLIEPRSDVTWRQEGHAEWRRFVQAAAPGG